MNSQATIPFTVDSGCQGVVGQLQHPDVYRIRIQPEHVTATAGSGSSSSSSVVVYKYLYAPNSSLGRCARGKRFHEDQNYKSSFTFDRVPAGDWTIAKLVPAAAAASGSSGAGVDDSKLNFASIEETFPLEGMTIKSAGPAWCGTAVDIDEWSAWRRAEYETGAEPDAQARGGVESSGYSSFKYGDLNPLLEVQCADYIDTHICPAATTSLNTSAPAVVGVYEWAPARWSPVEWESRAYRVISERDPTLAPRFLAHITESCSRVIGFVVEYIPGLQLAGPRDLPQCRAALARLHALGIALGRSVTERSCFLVRPQDGSVVLQRFVTAFKTTDADVFDNEMEQLEAALAKTSVFEQNAKRLANEDGRMKVLSPGRNEVYNALREAHGITHPFVLWLMSDDEEDDGAPGWDTVPFELHRELLDQWEANDWCFTEEMRKELEERFRRVQAAAGKGEAKLLEKAKI